MARVRLQLRTLSRSPEGDGDDEAWCTDLVGLVRKAVRQGRAAPAAVMRRPDRVDLLSLGPVQKAGVHMPSFLACLTRSQLPGAQPVDALAIIGVVRRTGGPKEQRVPVATVFVEWSDNRWWYWRALLGPDGAIREDTEVVQSAVDGDPLPSMFGRWWSHGRRARLSMRLAPAGPPPVEGPPGVVH